MPADRQSDGFWRCTRASLVARHPADQGWARLYVETAGPLAAVHVYVEGCSHVLSAGYLTVPLDALLRYLAGLPNLHTLNDCLGAEVKRDCCCRQPSERCPYFGLIRYKRSEVFYREGVSGNSKPREEQAACQGDSDLTDRDVEPEESNDSSDR